MRAAARAAAALLLALAPAACARGALVEPPLVAPLDSAVSLRAGQTAEIEGTTLRVRFVGVPADSRCPADVTCVWEGDAQVTLAVSGAGAGERRLDLHTALEPRAAEVGAFRVALEGVEPLPRSGEAIPAERYRAAVRVTRAPAPAAIAPPGR